MSDTNPFATKTATLTGADVDADEATAERAPAIGVPPLIDPFEGLVPEGDPSDVPTTASEMAEADAQAAEERFATAGMSDATKRPRTKRRVVRKVDLKALAQEMLMDGVANVLGYWHENEANQQKLAELGVTKEQLGEVLLQQADRAAKALGFEQAWSN